MNFSWLVLLLCASFVAAAKGVPKISRGSEAFPGEFPYVVSILLNDKHHCGGFIYSELYVVTTASCVYNATDGTLITSRQLKVVVGEFSLINVDQGEETYPVLVVKPHENYDSTTKLNNLAVLEVGRPINFTQYANFILYDEVINLIPDGIIMGWGANSSGGTLSTRLKKTYVAMTGDCTVYSASASIDSTLTICAGSQSDAGHPCDGDEGGPLVQNGIVVGLVSYQRNCGASPWFSAIYTRLSAHFFWLRANAGLQPTPPPTTIPTAPCQNCQTTPELPL